MITLASVGDLPALPLGVSYPKRKNWLLGKPSRTKKLKLGLKKETVHTFTVIKNISQFFEAVDPAQRATRIMKVWNKARKYGTQADRLYKKSIGYRYDHSGSKLPTGDQPLKKLGAKKGNRAAAYDLHKYAYAKSDKAMYVARKFANKVKGVKSAKVTKPSVNSAKDIAAYIIKTRRNRD